MCYWSLAAGFLTGKYRSEVDLGKSARGGNALKYLNEKGLGVLAALDEVADNAIYKIETKKPYGAKRIRKHLNKELKKLKRFFDDNLDFYKYYRSNNTHLDDKLFLRGKHDIKLGLDTYYLQSDQAFSTSHDYKVAKIMANDLVEVYIEDQLHTVNKHLIIKHPLANELHWTGSKAALIELIY